MKKLIALFTVAGFLTFGMANMAFAQNEQKTDNSAQTEEVAEAEEAPAEQAVLLEDADETPQQGLHYVLKEKYIQGGALWMTPVLICLILGLALVIERIFYLNLA
ncbi:MAG: MotA/TolQ/ExbB proton channel family protein, partial [Bacteroidales bacterium]|nr:MotA/TolQ/ExbB proton channel family protein [Bacteroidales bacterium]